MYEAPSRDSINFTSEYFSIYYPDGTVIRHKFTFGETCTLIPGSLPPLSSPAHMPGMLN